MKRLGKILVENVSSDSDFMKLLAISKGKLNPKDVDFDMEDLYKVDKDYVYFWFDEEEDLLTKFFDYDEYEAKDILWMYYRPGDYEFLTELGVGPNNGAVCFRINKLAVDQTNCRQLLAVKSDGAFEWLHCGKIALSKGSHKMTMKGRGGLIIIRTLAFRGSKSDPL